MRKWLLPRIAFGKSSLRGWWIIMSALLFLWGVFGNIRSDFISAADQEKWKLPSLFPQVSWYWLVIIFLILTLIALFEGAYKTHRKKVEEIELNFNAQKTTLENEIKTLKNRISELTKHKLRFEIKSYVAGIRDCGGSNIPSYAISVDATLRFENLASQPMKIKNLYISLWKRNGTEPEIKRDALTIFKNQQLLMWIDDSLSIPNFDITLHNFQFDLFVGPGMESYLSSNHFLRIGMEAINQPPYYQDLDIDLGELHKTAIKSSTTQ